MYILNNMRLPKILHKRIWPWISYPILVVATLIIFVQVFFIAIQNSVIAQGILPFEGTITNIEYNCLCSLGIKLTIQPTTALQTNVNDYMFYYGGQLLEELGIWPGDFPPPRVYLMYQIWYTGDQVLLGNYIPGGFPCVAYIPPYECSIEGYAQGAILNVGTSLY